MHSLYRALLLRGVIPNGSATTNSLQKSINPLWRYQESGIIKATYWMCWKLTMVERNEGPLFLVWTALHLYSTCYSFQHKGWSKFEDNPSLHGIFDYLVILVFIEVWKIPLILSMCHVNLACIQVYMVHGWIKGYNISFQHLEIWWHFRLPHQEPTNLSLMHNLIFISIFLMYLIIHRIVLVIQFPSYVCCSFDAGEYACPWLPHGWPDRKNTLSTGAAEDFVYPFWKGVSCILDWT